MHNVYVRVCVYAQRNPFSRLPADYAPLPPPVLPNFIIITGRRLKLHGSYPHHVIVR
jgi:hypothetical protein